MFGRRTTVPIDQIDPGPPLYPTDALFISLYQQYLLGTLEVEEAVIALEGIDRGGAPVIALYPRNDRFVMCDDDNVYFSCDELNMQDIPRVVLGRATGPHVRQRGSVDRPTRE